MRPRWQRTTRRDVYTVDVTAFLSLMVILVPFLLVTAGFSRTTILEIQPIGDAEAIAPHDSNEKGITWRIEKGRRIARLVRMAREDSSWTPMNKKIANAVAKWTLHCQAFPVPPNHHLRSDIFYSKDPSCRQILQLPRLL